MPQEQPATQPQPVVASGGSTTLVAVTTQDTFSGQQQNEQLQLPTTETSDKLASLKNSKAEMHDQEKLRKSQELSALKHVDASTNPAKAYGPNLGATQTPSSSEPTSEPSDSSLQASAPQPQPPPAQAVTDPATPSQPDPGNNPSTSSPSAYAAQQKHELLANLKAAIHGGTYGAAPTVAPPDPEAPPGPNPG